MLDSTGQNVKSMLSGRNGQISSARVLMFLFSAVAMGILISVFHHMMRITSDATLSIWIGGLPSIGGILIGLMAAPYTVNKGAGTVTDLVSLLVAGRTAVAAATPAAGPTTVINGNPSMSMIGDAQTGSPVQVPAVTNPSAPVDQDKG